MKTKTIKRLFNSLWLGLILSACTSSGIPLNITSVKVYPEPIVGQIVTLEVKIKSTDDEPYVKFSVDTREEIGGKVHLIGGDVNWEGSLVANQPQKLYVQVCVLEEGSWAVEFFVTAVSPESSMATLSAADGWSGSDLETIQLESTLESGSLIRGHEYTFSQEEHARRPTPRPFTVSPECSGN